MLDLDVSLPPGALCAADPGAVIGALDGALWWHGSPLSMAVDRRTGAVTHWHPVADGPDAVPTDANAGTGQLGEIDTMTGLHCRPGIHCGLVAEAATQDAATATLAVRFYVPPGEDARTLVTLNPASGDNYLFVSESAGMVTAKDDSGLITVEAPCPALDAARLVVVSLAGDRLAVSVGPARADAKAKKGVLQGPASLFIGCRNQRPRLLKTLGGALILDVWLFPGRALLHSDAEADLAALAALRRHHLWAGD